MKNKSFPYYSVPQFATISELLELTKNKYGEKIIFRTKKKKGDEAVSYNRLYDDVMKLTGDLMEFGFTPGPELGKTLNGLLEKVLTGELPNDRDALLATLPKFR